MTARWNNGNEDDSQSRLDLWGLDGHLRRRSTEQLQDQEIFIEAL